MGVAKGKTRPRLSLPTVQRYDIKNWPRPYLSVFVRICPYLSVFVKKNLFFLIFLDFMPKIWQNRCKIAEKSLYLQCSKQLWKSVDVKVLRCEDVKVFRVFSGILCAVSEHFNTSTS